MEEFEGPLLGWGWRAELFEPLGVVGDGDRDGVAGQGAEVVEQVAEAAGL